jgi:hypothetical protein
MVCNLGHREDLSGGFAMHGLIAEITHNVVARVGGEDRGTGIFA